MLNIRVILNLIASPSLICILLSPLSASANELNEFRFLEYIAEYSLYRDDEVVGSAARRLIREEEGYRLSFHTNASKYFYSISTDEESYFSLGNNYLIPKYYRSLEQRTFKKDMFLKLDFDYKNKKIVANSNNGTKSESLVLYTLDPLLVYEAVRLSYLLYDEDSKQTIIRYPVFDKRGEREYQFIIQGFETITTKLGKLKCVKLTKFRENKKRQTHFWLSIKHHYLPIKLVHEKNGDEVATMLVESIQFK